MTQIFGFTRVRKSVMESCTKMVETMIQKQRKFDYNYYMTKNCPLLDNWNKRKEQFKVMAITSP